MIERFQSRAFRERIKIECRERGGHTNPSAYLAADGRWDLLRLVNTEKHPELAGLDFATIAERRGQDPYDMVFDLLEEEERQLMIVGGFHDEADLRRILSHACCIVESDEMAYSASSAVGKPHPRAYGTFPMVFRKYVRGETRSDFPLEEGAKLLALEEAIKKMTSMPARRLGLQDRGLIRPNMWADLVIFDPARISDRATYEEPHQYPEGIGWVLVNGTVVVAQGKHQGGLPGRVLRKPA